MLLLASTASGRTRAVMRMARELSLGMSFFRGAVSLEQQLDGPLRRIVLLTTRDLDAASVDVLLRAAGNTPFGLVVSASREVLRLRNQDRLLDELQQLGNVAWLGMRYSADELAQAARDCRRGLLRLSRQELEHAFAGEQLALHYQPKVEHSDARAWRTQEVEALLRWNHPRHGCLAAPEFLPELDEFGLAARVGDWALREAARQLVAWREQGLAVNACINLASSLLADPFLPDTCERIVTASGLACSNFTFEVIEQDIAGSDAPHLATLNALRARGFRISLDHFGIAAASLGTLERLPVDEIKIHAAALARARQSDVGQKILAAVTGLAHNLGISVCADGVEDEATRGFLKIIECDRMQGLLISPAVLPEVIRSRYGPAEAVA